MSEVDANTLVSHEQDGRVLSGMGADAEKLAETMERHAPPEPAAKPGAEPAVEPGKPADATPKPSRGAQRFSDLTRERDEARGETAKERAAREALEKEVADLRAKTAAPAAAVAEPAKAEPAKAAEPTRPEPSEDEIGTKYETYAAFARDLAKWVVEQERAAFDPHATVREILAQEREVEQFRSLLRTTQDRARKAYPDFDTLLNGPAGEIVIGPTPESGHERVSFILQHPQSEHLQYAILKDPALAKRLQASDDVTFGVTIAGLVPAAPAPKPAWTPPPSPHPTVGASSPTTPTPSSELAKKGFDFDNSGYREKRAAERAAQRRR